MGILFVDTIVVLIELTQHSPNSDAGAVTLYCHLLSVYTLLLSCLHKLQSRMDSAGKKSPVTGQ